MEGKEKTKKMQSGIEINNERQKERKNKSEETQQQTTQKEK
jgi:hypothetical protein